jgi:hypothetical protein
MNTKLKHSKFKNTGVLFELLVRQIASDTLNEKNSIGLSIIKKHFKQGSELSKELKMYQYLVKENFDNTYKASEFLNIILVERKKLNETNLKKEKYNLIKSINEKFDAKDFFKYRVNNYKSLATIYKLFENQENTSPKEWVECKNQILENITKTKKPIKEENTDLYSKESKDVRLLAYKFLVDKFNDKYKELTNEQKSVLRNYINNIDNSDNLKRFILRESKKLKNEFSKFKITDKVSSIKLKEVIGLIDNLSNAKIVSEVQALGLLRYYQLLNELKGVQ